MPAHWPWSVILIATLFLLPCPAAVQGEDTGPLLVFMDEPIPPYTYGNEGEVCQKGVTKDILDELFGRLGMRFEIRLVPWARALDYARYGECDGVPLLIKTESRNVFLAFTDPVIENRELVFFLTERFDDFQWDDVSDLEEYNIGLVRGYTYGEMLMGAIKRKKVSVTYAKDSKMNFSMLQAGRVDVIVEDETVSMTILASHPEWAKRTGFAEKPISSYNWRIGISRKSPLVEHLGAINRVLDEMRADGSLETILKARIKP